MCVWRPVIGWLTADHRNAGLWLADWPPGSRLTNSGAVWLVWPVHHWSVVVTIGQCWRPLVSLGGDTSCTVTSGDQVQVHSHHQSYYGWGNRNYPTSGSIMGVLYICSCFNISVLLIVKVNLLDFRCGTTFYYWHLLDISCNCRTDWSGLDLAGRLVDDDWPEARTGVFWRAFKD